MSRKLAVKTVQMLDQRVGVALDIGAAGAEQFGLDGMETTVGVGPGIDLRVEFRNKAGGEDFRTLPAGARREPGFLGARQIVRGDALAQIARARQRLADALDHVRPIALGRVVERRGIAARAHPGKRNSRTRHPRHSHINHRLNAP